MLTGAAPWEISDSALIAGLSAVKGRAFVAFKPPSKPPTSTTIRTELVKFRQTPITRGTRPAVSAADVAQGLAAVQQLGGKVRKFFHMMGLAAVTIDPEAGPLLRRSPYVDVVEPVDTTDRLIGVIAVRSAASPWNVLGSISALTEEIPSNLDTMRLPLAWPYSTGFGPQVLFIDTGYERGHGDLPYLNSWQCPNNSAYCFVDGGPKPHGTLVMGVMFALQNDQYIIGAAYGISPYNVFLWRACDNNGNCDAGELVDALNWSANWLGGRTVINVSIAGNCTFSKSTAVATAYNAGHVLVAGVGNDGQYLQRCIAAYSQVIGVGGIKRDRTLAAPGPNLDLGCSSEDKGTNWGYTDVVAPYWARTTYPSGWPPVYDACGTSMAAPMVAGVAALIRARFTWTNQQVYDQILRTAQPLGSSFYFGAGLVRAHFAVALTPPELTPSVVSSKATLTWPPIPFAGNYEVYWSVSLPGGGGCPWELWGTTTSTTFTLQAPQVTSYYGSSPPPSQAAVGLKVRSRAAEVGTVSDFSVPAWFLTVSSNPPC